MALTFVFILSACREESIYPVTSIPATHSEIASTSTDDTQTSETDTDKNLSDFETPSNSTPTSSKPTDTTSTPTTNTSRPNTNSNSTTAHTHIYSAATCNEPKKCKICSAISGKALGHNYENGMCKRCSAKDPNYVQYTIIYNANGGWGETKSSTHIYNESRSLSKNGFKRAGYIFMGWSKNAQAINAEYNNCQTIKNLTIVDDETIILYAVWKECQTSKFDECQRAVTGKKEVNYHASIVDNMGNLHNDVAVFTNNDYFGDIRYDERYTKGLFTKIKGTLYLGGEFTVDNYTSLKIIIKADGKKVYESDFFTKYSGAKNFNVDITGANIVEIRVLDPESNYISHWNKGGDIIIENLSLIR